MVDLNYDIAFLEIIAAPSFHVALKMNAKSSNYLCATAPFHWRSHLDRLLSSLLYHFCT